MSMKLSKFRHFAISKLQTAKSGGFSLIEIMMIIGLMSTIIIPFTMLMTQTSVTARGTYVQSSRSMLLNSMMDEMSPDRVDYYYTFHGDDTKDTITESGRTIPYLRKVDVSKSDSFKKTTYFYLYNETTDANTSPRYKSTLTHQADAYYWQSSGNDVIGPHGHQWQTNYYYDSSADTPGCPSGAGNGCPTGYYNLGWGYNHLNASSLVTAANDTYDMADCLFQLSRTGNPIEIRFNVTNGDYVVKLYFSNAAGAVNDTTQRLLIDILLEGTTYKTAYSPYETVRDIVTPTATPTNTINIQEFDVSVTDGVLNVRLNKNASSYFNPIVSAIVVHKRRHQ